MNYNKIKVNEINEIASLYELSSINKREHTSEKISDFIAGKLDPKFKGIDWSKAGNDYDYLPWAEGRNYIELWKERHSFNTYYQTNKLIELPVLFEIVISYDRRQNIDSREWLEIQAKFFKNLFKEENVLSMMFHYNSEKQPHCHLLIYPVDDTGQVNAGLWEENGVIHPEIQNNYLDYLKQYHLDEDSILTEIANQDLSIYRTVDETTPYLDTIDEYIPEKLRSLEDDCEMEYDARNIKKAAASDITFERQEYLLDKILNYYSTIEKRTITQTRLGNISKRQFLKDTEEFMRHELKVTEKEVPIMLERVNEAVFGYYVIEDLINDDSISDIKVLGPDKIRVKRYGKRMTSNLHFRDMLDYWRFMEGVAIKNHTTLDPYNAVQNFTDKDTNKNFILRFNITTNYVNSVSYPYLHIRKIAKTKYSIEDLLHYKMMDMKTASYLLDKVKNATGIIFTGKGASGKTTLMNVLLEHIPYTKAGAVIQENEELFSVNHPDLMFQHIVTSRQKGQIEYSLQDLARNGLLTDLDYFIIGEIKGAEALSFLNAAYTGHQCWASVHGASSTEAMNKLADYVKYASDYSKDEILKMLHTMQVIVFMKDFKIYEISEVVGWDEKEHNLKYKKIYQYHEN